MRTNDDLYADLIEQAHRLLTTHEFGSSAQRAAKLRETIYLMDAHEAGQDITLAKLAWDDDGHRTENPIARLSLHLGPRMPGNVASAIDMGNGYFIVGDERDVDTLCLYPFVGLSDDVLELGR